MVTTTLGVFKQTRHLGGSISTGVYDDGELESLLVAPGEEAKGEARGKQLLSPDLLAQILAGQKEKKDV